VLRVLSFRGVEIQKFREQVYNRETIKGGGKRHMGFLKSWSEFWSLGFSTVGRGLLADLENLKSARVNPAGDWHLSLMVGPLIIENGVQQYVISEAPGCFTYV
jgi:hypothetical protein